MLYDIRPKFRNGKKIKYRKKYGELSERSRRRYRSLVDARPLNVRKRDPIDRVKSTRKRAAVKKSVYQAPKNVSRKRPTIGRKKGYTQKQLQQLASKGKIPKGALYGYNQFYLPYLKENESRSPVVQVPEEDEEELEEGEEEEITPDEFYELSEEEQKKVVLQRISMYGSLEEAIEDQDLADDYYYTSGGQIRKATFVDKVFYFVEVGEGARSVPLYRTTPKWMKRK